jgi:hypothetical protein
VRRLPGDERLVRFGEAEDATAEGVPLVTEVLVLDRGERRLLGLVVRIEPALLVSVPAPRGALDAGAVEDAQVRCEPLEVLGTRMLCREEMVCLRRPGDSDSANLELPARNSSEVSLWVTRSS